jgi:hypothetical protein
LRSAPGLALGRDWKPGNREPARPMPGPPSFRRPGGANPPRPRLGERGPDRPGRRGEGGSAGWSEFQPAAAEARALPTAISAVSDAIARARLAGWTGGSRAERDPEAAGRRRRKSAAAQRSGRAAPGGGGDRSRFRGGDRWIGRLAANYGRVRSSMGRYRTSGAGHHTEHSPWWTIGRQVWVPKSGAYPVRRRRSGGGHPGFAVPDPWGGGCAQPLGGDGYARPR